MNKKQIIVGSVIVLTALSIVMFMNHILFQGPWKKIASFKNRDLNEQYLCSFRFDIDGYKDTITTIYKDNNYILFYRGFDNNELIQDIKLEGDLIDYFYISDHKLYYFTIRTKEGNKIVIYKLNKKFEYLATYNADCTKYEDGYTELNYQSNSDIIAIRSEDKYKVQLFKPPFQIVYEYKHNRPFVIAHSGYNIVFDGDLFFDVYKPQNVLRKMNYSGARFNSSILDMNKLFLINDSWLYNNNYLLSFDDSLNVKSITKHEDLYQIIPKDTHSKSDSGSFYYINSDGFYEYNKDISIAIVSAQNTKYNGLVLENTEIFSSNNNNKINIYAYINDPITGKRIIQEYKNLEGRFLDVWQDNCVLYIFTTDGVYCMDYPYKPIKTYNIE